MGGTESEVRRMWTMMGLVVILTASVCQGLTDPLDVFAINSLHAALGSPPLPGWVPLGGDPCLEAWQGVQCVNSNITGISLNGANLGGELGTNLDSFNSIISIDLSGNHIGGTIPSNLPPTMRTFFLSANQFTGSIPDGLSSLGQITDLSLNNNNLTGAIPDAFQPLTGLINLDLSGNNLSGPLPPSMGNLTSLTTLHLQDNKLTGMLDVLQDLALSDLNIENNQFSGPVPPKLLTVPNFRSTGNPFNTTVLSSPPAPSPAAVSNSTLPKEPPPKVSPKLATPPSVSESRNSFPSTTKKSLTAKTIMWSAIVVLLLLLGIGLGLALCVSKCRNTGGKDEKLIAGPDETSWYKQTGLKSKCGESLPETYKQTDLGMKPRDARKVNDKKKTDVMGTSDYTRNKDDHTIDMKGANISSIVTPQPPPPRLYSSETKCAEPVVGPKESSMRKQTVALNTPSSLKSFTVAMLQEYTDSFCQENLIGEGVLGSVYRAELPDGQLVAVKKLNATTQQRDKEFADLLLALSKLQHRNIVNLIGYCFEYDQRLLVYEYCNNGTLHEALHFDDEIHRRLSWNSRVRIALGAASALEYMHEFCQPPIVHKNFKSLNILLDDQLMPQISDCGLAPLFANETKIQLAQLSASGYGAPELEHGSFTQQSDVFSFGVVMLELLTGRKSYDRSRARGDQFLVTWAVSRLHDIESLSKMVDPSLKGAYPSKALSRFADIISLCLQGEPEFRPPMSEIVQRLQNMVQKEP